VIPAYETFTPLAALPHIFHAFTLRTDADTKSPAYEQQLVAAFGYHHFARAEQTHGNNVALVTTPGHHTVADALITRTRHLPLLIRCADCAPIFLVAPHAIGLIHSGKKGTLANIVAPTVAAMQRDLHVAPADLIAVIAPSIGPCHYDLDLWTPLETQLRNAGIHHVHNERRCTACHLDRYFSYRAEKGQTGRMFSILALR
jgi:copper oxidase (laccase) domain-containing protein